jgi:hypothetical protein
MLNKAGINANGIQEIDGDEMQTFIETVRSLPEDYRKTLHGAAIGLKLAAELNQPPAPPTLPAAAAKAAV